MPAGPAARLAGARAIPPVEGRPATIRNEIRNRSVKKTLALCFWLDEEAERYHINFSQVLQEALKERLGS